MAPTVTKKNIRKVSRQLHEFFLEDWDYTEHYKEEANPPLRPSTRQDILEGLEILRDSFLKVYYDHEDSLLSVVTEPIVLKDIDLGRFKITLKLYFVLSLDPGEGEIVEALDPNPCWGNEDCTHPYVLDDEICLGQGNTAYRRALDEGRYADALLIVNQVLLSGDQGHGHESLDDWQGIKCGVCGKLFDPEDYIECENCGIAFCDDCAIECNDCGDIYCKDCMTKCSDCGSYLCHWCTWECPDCGETCCEDCRDTCWNCGEECCDECLEACARCHNFFCKECLKDGLCDNCRETLEQEKSDGKKKEAKSKRSKHGRKASRSKVKKRRNR